MKDHIYRHRRLPSTPACLAERETTGRRFCYGFDCGCIDRLIASTIEARDADLAAAIEAEEVAR